MTRRVPNARLAASLLLVLSWGCERTESTTGATGATPTTTPDPPKPPPPPPATTSAPPVVQPPPEPVGTCNAMASRTDKKRDLSRRENKIVGGKPAPNTDFGFTVALATGTVEKPSQYCGGSLIADRWVLTAAHCQVRAGELVITGRHDLTSSGGAVVEVEKVLNHADYDADTNNNDLALVKLAQASKLSNVALFAGGKALEGDSVVVGWGRLQEGGATSPLLQQVVVPFVTKSKCEAGYAPDGISITDNMLCAGLAAGGKDSCQGDSGGPLLVKGGDGGWQQAGIVSFGIGCARPNRYGVYTKVSNYVPWIKACMAQ